ncbi:NAD(P)H-binding protein [Nocardia arthritidis]|uniref:NAD(P)H-binding protein n=1 Tax=Nocardia arthritidis TaxID=228602 RepID=A0A6G9YS36_9NOCA|nr:NAD(P)H-binding protein [Nocardia arthritidis]QIS16042.1 NAD(P)H-binding protein [Nocardia arthritidis]
MTILVTGARGNIGARLVATLAAAGHDVRASARDLAGLPPGVPAVELDTTAPHNAAAALRDVSAVFLYTARADTAEFLRAAKEFGVGHIVLLSSPAAFEAGEFDKRIGLLHRAAEAAVVKSGLSHTILYPSWLATNARRDWGAQIRETGRVAMAYPDARVSPIHIDDIAEVAANLLVREDNRARMLMLTGPESLRLRDLVDTLGDVLGQEIPVDELTREQALARATLPAPVLEILLDTSARSVGVPAALTNTVERVTGHPARPFRDWALAHHADFAA